MGRSAAVALFAALWGCGLESPEGIRLPNGAGKDDSVAIRLKLTDSSPVVGFTVGCDQPTGCTGHLDVKLVTPAPCTLFPSEARCGIARTDALSRDLVTTTITSTTEGRRTLPLRVESTDGTQFTQNLAAAFTAKGDEDVEFSLDKLAGTPDLLVEVKAVWTAAVDPGAEPAEVVAFLGSVPGLTYAETGTAFPGYRAYVLQYAQPLDHQHPELGTFPQQMVLHHKSKTAPTVLYTSGYQLYTHDYLSELATALGGNQLATEQRWFGTSHPAEITPESWRHVDIEQAANDHHRITEALRAFYAGKWVATGHSKGGMTSVFHHRFFPQDLDATIAYVAPISYAVEDPRYVPFLDTIGERACREAIRGVQRRALEQRDALEARARQDLVGDETFVRTGGFASSLEKSVLLLEWAFWQYLRASDCAPFLTAGSDLESTYTLIANYAGIGMADSVFADIQPYYFQAATQLGNQRFATAHLDGLLLHTDKQIDLAPAGTMPVHDPAAMLDVQQWVKTEARHIMFIYGQFDPWTGGAYEVPSSEHLVKLVAPGAPHATYLHDLAPADREVAATKLEQWLGVRPNIASAMGTPNPALPRVMF